MNTISSLIIVLQQRNHQAVFKKFARAVLNWLRSPINLIDLGRLFQVFAPLYKKAPSLR